MKYFRAAVLLILLFAGGCCSDHLPKSVTEFKRRDPGAFRDYVYIYPISLDTYDYLEGQQRAALTDFALGVEKKYGTTNGLKEYLESEVYQISTNGFFDVVDYYHLEKLVKSGGTVCQFKWDNGQRVEMGLLVLKNGYIILRDVWMTNFRPTPEDKSEGK